MACSCPVVSCGAGFGFGAAVAVGAGGAFGACEAEAFAAFCSGGSDGYGACDAAGAATFGGVSALFPPATLPMTARAANAPTPVRILCRANQFRRFGVICSNDTQDGVG